MKSIFLAAATVLAIGGSAFALAGVNGMGLNMAGVNGTSLNSAANVDLNSLRVLHAAIRR